MTVVETSAFVRDASSLFSDAERMSLISFIAANPEVGGIMPETGGVRKFRWAAKGKGKRGGARIIYYYHSESLPLFLLNVFAKNEKVNLSKAERIEIKKLVPRLVSGYLKGAKT